MTIFACDTCSCDCPAPCAFTGADCFEISFSGFSSSVNPGYSCAACNTIDDHTIIAKRGTVQTLRARASAVRPGTASEGDEGAEFEVTLSRDAETDAYTVSSISIVDGGSGYLLGTKIVFEFGYVVISGGQELFMSGHGLVRCDRHPFAWITSIGRTQPQVEATLGCFEELSVSLTQGTDGNGRPIWSVDSVSVESGGVECEDGSEVSFSTPNGVQVSAASAVARTGRSQPSLGVALGGDPASASITLSESQDANGRSVWVVESVESLLAPGEPPKQGDPVTIVPFGDVVVISPAAAVVDSVDEFGAVTVAVTSPGAYYEDTGVVESVEVAGGGEYYRGGAITGVSLVKGGEIYNTDSGNACVFRGRICNSCPTEYGQEVAGLITFSSDSGSGLKATLQITFFSTISNGLLVSTATGIAPGDESIDFTSFSTQELCETAGAVTINAVPCDTEPQSPCAAMPRQVEVTISGLSNGAELYGLDVDDYPPQQAAANAECETATNAQCFIPVAPGFGGLSGSSSIGEDAVVVCDLVAESCSQYTYAGVTPPRWSYSTSTGEVACNSEPIAVEIAKAPCDIEVLAIRQETASTKNSLCPPDDTCPRGDEGVSDAILAVASTADGAITEIGVESPGSCYAWRVFNYLEPEAVADSPTPLGAGATFTISWEQYENSDGDDRWRVASILGEGGSGYIDNDAVTLELNEGTCGFGFSGYIITKRLEPEPSLELPSPGSGAELSYTLSEVAPPCYDQYSITGAVVISPGDNYKDGASVLVDSDGEADEEASLSLSVLRTEPTVTASVGDATLTVVLQESEDFSGKPVWAVGSVSVENGGAGGQSNGATVSFGVTADEIVIPPFATAQVDDDGVVVAVTVIVPGEFYNDTGPIDGVTVESGGYYCGPDAETPPTFTATLPGGDGGEISISSAVGRRLPCYKTWEFASVTVDEPGNGYKDREEITITLEEGAVTAPATLIIRVLRGEPVVTATLGNSTLSVSLVESVDAFGDPVWAVGSVTVVDGGSGIAASSMVAFSLSGGSINLAPTAYAEVDEDGSVTAVVVQFGGELVDDIGPIDSVEIQNAGQYWTTDSSVGCVVVGNGGEYYRAVQSGVESDAPEIRIFTPCGGGATATAVVDVDPESDTFGGIAEVIVDEGGEGYYPLGDAWFVTVVGLLVHMTENQPFGYPDPDAGGAGWLGNDFGHNAHEILTNRASVLCPSDLLSREYRMFYRSSGGAGGVQDANGEPCGKWFREPGAGGPAVVRRFGAQDIKCTLRPI